MNWLFRLPILMQNATPFFIKNTESLPIPSRTTSNKKGIFIWKNWISSEIRFQKNLHTGSVQYFNISCSFDKSDFKRTFRLYFTISSYVAEKLEIFTFEYDCNNLYLLLQCALISYGTPVLSENRIFDDEINKIMDVMNDSDSLIDVSNLRKDDDKWIIAIIGAFYGENRTTYDNLIRLLERFI